MAKKAYIGVNGVARKIKKGYVGVENFTKRNLPAGYTQVAYIESTGNQYLNTRFYPSYNTRVVVEISDATDSSYIFGARDADSTTAANQFGAYITGSSALRSDYFGTNVSATPSNIAARTIVDKNANVTTAFGLTQTNTAVTSGAVSYPLYLFALNTAGTVKAQSSLKMHSALIYGNGVDLDLDYVTCIQDSTGIAGMYDMVNNTFEKSAGTEEFIAGPTYESIARKIKKAYIGIGGVARPCWSGGELAYYGTISGLNAAGEDPAATSVGNYALFAGGYYVNDDWDSMYTSAVTAYNKSLTKSTPASLSLARFQLAATTVGNYALFAGGYRDAMQKTVDAYNTSLTRSTPSSLGQARSAHVATTVGDYALFAGGYDGGKAYNNVDAYNSSTTKVSVKNLSSLRYRAGAATIGNYALIAGGNNYDGTVFQTVETYDTSLTKSTATSLTMKCNVPAATTVGDYALFFGYSSSVLYCIVDAYDKSLTRTNIENPSVRRDYLRATTVGDYALFAGGTSGSTIYDTVDVYDKSLTRTTGTPLSVPRDSMAATTIGDYALFGGGCQPANSSLETYTNIVDAYVVA